MLIVNHLTLKTRHTILDDFSFQFEKGKLYGISAPNGSGKTTFFRALNGLIPIATGNILIDEQPVTQRKQDVFYFEDHAWLDGNLSGRDYLNFVKKAWRSTISVTDIIQQLSLAEYINIPIRKYSLGMKQKLILAMYIVSDASYLIMDEISNGLDEDNRNMLFSWLRQLAHSQKMIMLSSHYADDIFHQCDCVLSFTHQKLEVSSQ